MMKIRIYAIHDIKAKCFQRPFFCKEDGEATRVFSDIAQDVEHPIGKHPEDYSLFRIGQYDDNEANVEGELIECIATGMGVINGNEETL